MADSDSDASSTASDTMLIVRPASTLKPDPLRYERSYSRRLLLQLSKSDKIRPPAGLKPLSEWYGEYELPSLHPVNSSANAGANGRFAGRDGQPGGRRERERDRGAPPVGSQGDRYAVERDAPARPNAGAPATGQMGDFKLAGQRPFTLPKDGDGGDALSGGSRRRQNLRDTDLRDRGVDGRDKDWAAATGPGADRRRQLGGEFIKKDGRAAEEGGWRSSRETMQLGRERIQRGDRPDRLDRPSYNDRDVRGQPSSSSDRRRQPAWMEEEEASNSTRHGSSNAFQRRGQNGYQTNDASPAWMADEPANVKGRPDSSLEALEARSRAGQSSSEETHVDSIQAFKAQMKEMERRQKVQEQKELRREMGRPEMSDEDLLRKADVKKESSEKAQTAPQQGQTAPPKSVFADFLLPSSSSKEKETPKVVEDKPRSSRFARMFAAEAAATQGPDRGSPAAASAPSPSHLPSSAINMPQSSSSNNLLAALLPGASKSPAQQPDRGVSSPMPPPPSSTDNQSMARLMEMLHMSSAPPSAVSPLPKHDHNSPGISSLFQEAKTNGQSRTSSSSHGPRQQAQNRPQYQTDGLGNVEVGRNEVYSPDYSGQQLPSEQMYSKLPSQPGVQQPQLQHNRDAISSSQHMPQSRLANRGSGYGLNSVNDGPSPLQIARRQENLQAPLPPPQRSVNLLDLLAGHVTPPPGPPSSHSQNMIPSQHQQHHQQQQSMRGQPVQSPPPRGYFPTSNAGIPDQQHAQMTAFLQSQPGTTGRPLPPPGVPGNGNNLQFGRPPGQPAFLPPQGPYYPHQGPFPPHQQQQHPGHMRSPSGHMNAAQLPQEHQQRMPSNSQQQQQAFNSMRGEGSANQPLPPPQAFAQQNALAQLLAQSGHPGQQYSGMRSLPTGPQGYQQHQTLPPPPMHMHQNPSPMHMHQSPPAIQQNQIDLMALLTGGGHGNGFAGR